MSRCKETLLWSALVVPALPCSSDSRCHVWFPAGCRGRRRRLRPPAASRWPSHRRSPRRPPAARPRTAWHDVARQQSWRSAAGGCASFLPGIIIAPDAGSGGAGAAAQAGCGAAHTSGGSRCGGGGGGGLDRALRRGGSLCVGALLTVRATQAERGCSKAVACQMAEGTAKACGGQPDTRPCSALWNWVLQGEGNARCRVLLRQCCGGQDLQPACQSSAAARCHAPVGSGFVDRAVQLLHAVACVACAVYHQCASRKT